MEVRLLRVTTKGEELVEYATSVSSHRIPMEVLVENDYSSVLEHIVFTFDIHGLSIAASRELLEHRISSHTARSTRYNEEEAFEYYRPRIDDEALRIYEEAIACAREAYKKLRSLGVKREHARYVLPMATHSHYILTMNARSLINFLSLRLCVRASPEMRELATKMLKICREEYPQIFSSVFCRGVTQGTCPENDFRPKECPFREVIPTRNSLRTENLRGIVEEMLAGGSGERGEKEGQRD